MLVPGCPHDLFLSYAHIEADWVEGFKKAFSKEFHVREGKPVSIWHDAKNLRLGEDWPDSLADAVKGAAALLAILSPSYHNSDWCQRERAILLEHYGDFDRLKVGNFSRFLKILKAPHTYDVWAKLQHVKFFNEAGAEFPQNSPEFQVAIGDCVRAIRELFRLMCNGQTCLYLARAPFELTQERRQLETELTGRGYKIRPDVALDATYGHAALVKEMEPCSRAIFLFGAKHDKFVQDQIKQAVAQKIPILSWIHPRLVETASAEQQRFLKEFGERQDLPPGSEGFGGHSITALREQLEPRLKDKPPAAAHCTLEAKKLRVHLIFDATIAHECGAASRIAAVLTDHGLNVVQARTIEDHESFMRSADAVLLLRCTAYEADRWLHLNAQEMAHSKQLFQRESDFIAKTILAVDPSQVKASDDTLLLPYSDPFSPATLDPFFAKLARARSADAGR